MCISLNKYSIFLCNHKLNIIPKINTVPPVMYSQAWSPTPSTTAMAPEFLTANLSDAIPLIYARPEVAPYRHTFPAITLRCDSNGDVFGG